MTEAEVADLAPGLADAERLKSDGLRAEPSLAGRIVSAQLPRRLVPAPVGVRLALLAGNLGGLFPGPRRRAAEGLRVVLPPETSDRALRRVARKQLGERLAFLELFFRPWRMDKIEVLGEQNLAEARRGGRGAIVAIMHFGLWWAISLALLQRGVKVYVVRFGAVEDAPTHHGLMARYGVERLRLHEELGGRIVGRGGSYAVLRALLERGEVCSINADPPSSDASAPSTVFRGKRVRFATGIGRLSKEAGVPIQPAVAYREGARPVVRLLEPLASDDFANAEAMRVRLTNVFDRELSGREELSGAQLLANLRAGLGEKL